jgi:lysophospholipase L1-like esterase
MLPQCCRTVALAFTFGICSGAAALALAQDDDPASRQIELKKGDKIIFFGDSLTDMSAREVPKDLIKKGYVRIVRETLQEKHPDKDIEVQGIGYGGSSVLGLLSRVDADVLAKKPTIVVIQIGVPDAIRKISKEDFKAGLEKLIAKLRNAGVQVVLCSLTSYGEKHDGSNSSDARLEEFAAVARTVAKEQNIPLNDLRKAFVGYWKKNNKDNKGSGLLTYDGNHFNQTGMDFVAEQMLKKFR